MDGAINTPNAEIWSVDTIFEMFGDMVCFEFILEIMRRMKNREAKGYISGFLKLLAPIYAHELISALEDVELVNRHTLVSSDVRRFINNERQRALKSIITEAPRAITAIEEMGIDFSKEIYDINIVVKENKLLDTNYEQYTDTINDTLLWEKLYATPKAIVVGIIAALSQVGIPIDMDAIMASMDPELTAAAEKLDQDLDCTRYSYPSCRLFKNASGLTLADKIFILYRYRQVASARMIADLVPNLSVAIDGTKVIDSERFFRKYRAVVICIIGDQLQKSSTVFTSAIVKDLGQQITDSSFYRLNRKIRNNLHYKTTSILISEALTQVDMFQRIYLDVIVKHFDSCLNIEIDQECRKVTAYFNACLQQGMTHEEIGRHSYLRYLLFCFTGKLFKLA